MTRTAKSSICGFEGAAQVDGHEQPTACSPRYCPPENRDAPARTCRGSRAEEIGGQINHERANAPQNDGCGGEQQDKTIVVRVERVLRHPVYKKVLTRGKNYSAHDEKGEAKAGDLVQIVETRPSSRTKRFALEQVLKKRQAVSNDSTGISRSGGR